MPTGEHDRGGVGVHPGYRGPKLLADLTVATTPAGLAQLLAFATGHAPGTRLAWVVEGTRSHGAGLLRVLRAAGQHVIEAPRASRKNRRSGKSDPLDAIAAGRAALGSHRPSRASTEFAKTCASCWPPART